MKRCGIVLVVAMVACGEPDWQEDREPVVETSPGGALSEVASELQFDPDPRLVVYTAPPDLRLGEDTAGVRPRPPGSGLTPAAAPDADSAPTPPAADTAASDTIQW